MNCQPAAPTREGFTLAGAAGWQDGIASPQRQQGIALLALRAGQKVRVS